MLLEIDGEREVLFVEHDGVGKQARCIAAQRRAAVKADLAVGDGYSRAVEGRADRCRKLACGGERAFEIEQALADILARNGGRRHQQALHDLPAADAWKGAFDHGGRARNHRGREGGAVVLGNEISRRCDIDIGSGRCQAEVRETAAAGGYQNVVFIDGDHGEAQAFDAVIDHEPFQKARRRARRVGGGEHQDFAPPRGSRQGVAHLFGGGAEVWTKGLAGGYRHAVEAPAEVHDVALAARAAASCTGGSVDEKCCIVQERRPCQVRLCRVEGLIVVGRDLGVEGDAVETLAVLFRCNHAGHRRAVFVRGGPGILCDLSIADVAVENDVVVQLDMGAVDAIVDDGHLNAAAALLARNARIALGCVDPVERLKGVVFLRLEGAGIAEIGVVATAAASTPAAAASSQRKRRRREEQGEMFAIKTN